MVVVAAVGAGGAAVVVVVGSVVVVVGGDWGGVLGSPATVTRVPTGVYGQTMAASEMAISTHPLLWG